MNSILSKIAIWEGTDSDAEAFDFCDKLFEIYHNEHEPLRSVIRRAFVSKQTVCESLLFNTTGKSGPGGFLVEATRRMKKPADDDCYLRNALPAISITDGLDDSRNTLMWLADQGREAERQDFDPTPLYKEIANLCSKEVIHSIGSSIIDMILRLLDPDRRDQLKWSRVGWNKGDMQWKRNH